MILGKKYKSIVSWASGRAKTKHIHIIHTLPTNPKSPSASILLKQQLIDADSTRNSINHYNTNKRRNVMGNSNYNFLKRKNKRGPLICEYCDKLLKIVKGGSQNKEYIEVGATVDHKEPTTNGGEPIHFSNKAICCFSCNDEKSDLPWIDWVFIMKNNPEKYKGYVKNFKK